MADIYDVNAAIQKPNIVNALRQGQQYGMQLKQQQQQVADQNALRQLAPQIISGDQTAFAQGAAINPEQAGQYQQAGDSQLRRLKGAVDYFDKGLASGDDRIIQARYREIAPFLSNMTGRPAPEAYTPDMQPAFEQVKTKIALADLDPNRAELAPRVVGSALVDSTGKVLYQAPPEQKYQWSERAGAWIPMPGAGGATQGQPQTFEDGSQAPAPSMKGADGMPVAIDPSMSPQDIAAVQAMEGGNIPQNFSATNAPAVAQPGLAAIPVAGIGPKPDVSPAEERRLQLAEEAAQRAREAADRSRFGNAPAGFRFKPDGSLEAIPGGPKPAGSAASEDERKAAGWFMQANKAFDDMEAAISANPNADDPGILETYIPIDEIANRTRSPERQQYAQASGAFSEAVLRAATGAGVNRDEAIQKIRELTPQRGDSSEVKAQKRASLLNYLDALKSRAGRALPQGGSAPSAGGWKIRVKS